MKDSPNDSLYSEQGEILEIAVTDAQYSTARSLLRGNQGRSLSGVRTITLRVLGSTRTSEQAKNERDGRGANGFGGRIPLRYRVFMLKLTDVASSAVNLKVEGRPRVGSFQ